MILLTLLQHLEALMKLNVAKTNEKQNKNDLKMENKNKNSICLLANIIPQKNNEYKKNPPTIIAIIQLMEYL